MTASTGSTSTAGHHGAGHHSAGHHRAGHHSAGHHRAGLENLDRELPPTPLITTGRFPSWLTGTLLRTGPAKFDAGGRDYSHWFDGLAMLHRFGFADGAVTYTNRFLRSRAYQAVRDTGQIAYSEFATDPCRTLFRRVATLFTAPQFGDNANVNVIRHEERFLALSETPLPVEFDPATLETLGVAAPAPGQLTTAHPHRAPGSGDLVNYATRFGPRTTYRVHAGGRLIATIPVTRPAYMHSFAITRRRVVLAEFPFVVTPAAIPLSGRPFIRNYRWRPGLGTRFRILDLATGATLGTCQGEPFFAFHHVNAYERGDEIIVDVCGYDDAGIIDALYLDRLRADGADVPRALVRRYRLRPGCDAVREPLPEIGMELPRIDYGRRNGAAYRYAYGVASDRAGGFPDQIVKADLSGGGATRWRQHLTYPGEPVFVPAPGGDREDSGILLSVVLDAGEDTSFLLALDAATLGEIGRAAVPHHVPFGFHGNYFPQLAQNEPG